MVTHGVTIKTILTSSLAARDPLKSLVGKVTEVSMEVIEDNTVSQHRKVAEEDQDMLDNKATGIRGEQGLGLAHCLKHLVHLVTM